MFCPSCGTDEHQPIQFCRTCGTNLRAVKTAIQQPDAITASAVSAREEVGRAIASRIETLERGKDLAAVASEVLPQIDKFLESPEERRLRRARAGVMTAAVGLGGMVFLLVLSIVVQQRGIPWPVGFIPFFVGIAMIFNALVFTVPKGHERSAAGGAPTGQGAGRLEAPGQAALAPPPGSVVESTTELLEERRAGTPRVRDTH